MTTYNLKFSHEKLMNMLCLDKSAYKHMKNIKRSLNCIIIMFKFTIWYTSKLRFVFLNVEFEEYWIQDEAYYPEELFCSNAYS